MLGLIALGSIMSIMAEEPTNLKVATAKEIASCGTKVALAEMLGDRSWRLLPSIGNNSNVLYQ